MALEDELREYLTGREQYGDRAHQLLRMVLAARTERKAPGEVEGLVERIRGRVNDAPLPSEYMLDEAADTLQSQATELATLKQQLAEREEALRRIAGLPKNYVGEQYKVAVLDIVGPGIRALTRADGGSQ